MQILPIPKTLVKSGGSVHFDGIEFYGPEKDLEIARLAFSERTGSNPISVIFEKDESLKPQTYRLIVSAEVTLTYSSPDGLFYGAHTARQLLAGNRVEKLEIYDEPDFENRGVMLDISRNKVPKTETLFSLVDFISSLKMNELQLYVEGRSFFYESFCSDYAADCDVLTKEDVHALN